MGQQGGWHKGMPGQGCAVMPAPKGRRAERRHRATRGARTAWHRAPPVGDHPRPVQHRAPTVGDHPCPYSYGLNTQAIFARSPADQIRPAGDGTESLAQRFSYLQSSYSSKPAKRVYVTPATALTRSQHNAISRRVGPGDRQSAALSAGRKTRMGQQGCWHKGMSGQGCHVMPGPKGRRAERRHRATRGARTAWHRAPPVGDTPGLCSTGHHPLANTRTSVTSNPTRMRHPRPVQHRAPPVGDHTDLCHTGPHP